MALSGSISLSPFSYNLSMSTFSSPKSSRGEAEMSQNAFGRWKSGTIVRPTVHQKTNVAGLLTHSYTVFFNFKLNWWTVKDIQLVCSLKSSTVTYSVLMTLYFLSNCHKSVVTSLVYSQATVISYTLNKMYMSLTVSAALRWDSGLLFSPMQTVAISSLVHFGHERM